MRIEDRPRGMTCAPALSRNVVEVTAPAGFHFGFTRNSAIAHATTPFTSSAPFVNLGPTGAPIHRTPLWKSALLL